MLIQTINVLDKLRVQPTFKVAQTHDQRLENISGTIISLQYGSNNFLTFKVYEASEGVLKGQDMGNISLECKIRGTTYIFSSEHLFQLSKRELDELFNQLGIQSSNFCLI